MASGTGGNARGTNYADIASAVGAALAQQQQEQDAAQNRTNGRVDTLADFYGQEANRGLNEARTTLPFVGADKTVRPYADLALRRSLIGGLNNDRTVNAPGRAGEYQGDVNLPVDYDNLRNTANQYLSDDVLGNAWTQQQNQIVNASPTTPAMNSGGMFGAGSNADANVAAHQQSAALYQGRNLNNQRTALEKSLQTANKGSNGSGAGATAANIATAAAPIVGQNVAQNYADRHGNQNQARNTGNNSPSAGGGHWYDFLQYLLPGGGGSSQPNAGNARDLPSGPPSQTGNTSGGVISGGFDISTAINLGDGTYLTRDGDIVDRYGNVLGHTNEGRE